MGKSDQRKQAIEAVEAQIESLRHLSEDELYTELYESVQQTALHIKRDCLARGFTDQYKLATLNSLMNQINRRDEIKRGAQPVGNILIGYLTPPSVDDVDA
jgi:hypothetical protein